MAERVQVREIDDDEGRRLLRIVRRGSGSAVTWRRAQMVLLSAQKMPVAKIAEVTFTGPDRVRDVIGISRLQRRRVRLAVPPVCRRPSADLQPARTPGDQENREVQARRARPAVLDLEPADERLRAIVARANVA